MSSTVYSISEMLLAYQGSILLEEFSVQWQVEMELAAYPKYGQIIDGNIYET